MNTESKKANQAITRDLALATHGAAKQWLADFLDIHEEAGRLACDMLADGSARLELRTVFDPQRLPAHRLLLIPADADDGMPVEVAVLGCEPEPPTPQGLEQRFWFYGRLGHWQPKH